MKPRTKRPPQRPALTLATPPPDVPRTGDDPDKYHRRAKSPMINLQSEWTVDDILAAQDAHERGETQQSGLLWQWMQRTPRLKAVLRKRAGALPALPFSLLPASGEKGGSPEERAVAAILEREWHRILPESLLRGIVRNAIGMGAALCRVHYEDDGRHWWPRLQLWPADSFYYRDSDCKWFARTREGGDIRITPGCGWFLWLPDGERSFQCGSVLSLAIPCLLTTLSNTDWANYNAANANIVRKVVVPRGATRAQKDAFFDQVEALGREDNVITCERNLDGSGFDFEYVTAEGKTIDTFERAKADASKEITIEVLGQEKTTDLGTEGARSAVESLQGVENAIIAADANGFATSLIEQVLGPLCAYNWGHAEWAAVPTWEVEAPQAAQDIAAGDKAVAESMTAMDEAMRGTGKKIDKALVAERAGWPLLEGEPPAAPLAPRFP